MAIVCFLLVLGYVVHRATTAEERGRLFDAAKANASGAYQRYLSSTPAEEEFDATVRERQKHAVLTLAILVVQIAAFAVMPGRGGSGGPEALVSWGASFGPRTTHGEWWRLLTSLVVESGYVAFLIHIVSLLSVGRVAERLVGARAFAATYLTAGVLAGVTNMALQPIAVASGSAGALLGLFGLVAGSWGRARLGPTALVVPSMVLQRVAPVAVVLFIHTVASGELTFSSASVGFLTGVAAGLAVMREPEARPSRRSVYLLASGWAVVVLLAVSVRAITDVRPVIDALAPLEARTSGAYETARRQFQAGRATAASLIEMIDRSILPELRAEQARIAAIEGVPREHEERIRDAADYLRHRTKSWELRAEGLRRLSGSFKRVDATNKSQESQPETRAQGQARHTANMMTLGRAETEERQALDTLQRLTSASS